MPPFRDSAGMPQQPDSFASACALCAALEVSEPIGDSEDLLCSFLTTQLE